MASYELESVNLEVNIAADSNISANITDAQSLSVTLGKAAEFNVGQAVTYIESGKAEVQAAVVEGMSAFDLNAEQKVADFNDNASNKTAAYNQNASDKTDDFNTNAENQFDDYNANASNKLNAYNDNATAKSADYDNNAATKTQAYNDNATAKTTAFNDNAAIKQSAVDASADAAAAQAELAKQWAIGEPSEPSGYSAKYWAEQSASSLSGLQSDVAGIKAVIPASATAGNKLTDKSYVDTGLSDKQDTLVSGSNIKTINNQSILGSGDLNVTASTAWGNITGTLSNQTDLQNALDAKANNADLASVATSGSYNDLSNKPDLSVYALDNAVVHLSGNETINGDKLFKGQAQFTAGIGISFKTSADDEYYVMRSSGAPATGCGLFLNNSASTAAFNVSTDKITIGSGNILPNSITPETSDSSTRIATTAYVKSNLSNYVSLEGNETIGGTKTFVVDTYIKNPTPKLYMKNTQQTKGTAPSADVWGGINFQDANGNLMGRCRQLYTSGKTNMVELRVYKANSSSDTTAASLGIKYPASGNPYVETGAYFRPSSDNSLNLGDSSHRWKQLYAGTTTISTSDERLKQDIENISDEILDVWGKVEFYRYKFKDAVAEKGKNARYHTGLIAQRIERIFAEHGLNAFDYGLLCYDEWQEQKEEKDEEGNIITPKIEAGNRYSLRYEECLCMEAAYQRYRADKIEARLAALEARL